MRIKIWVMSSILFLTSFFWLGVNAAHAQTGTSGDNGRSRVVDYRITQYVWQLEIDHNGKVVCEAVIDHEGTPTYYETLTFCPMQVFGSVLTPVPSPTPAPSETPEPFTPPPLSIDEATLFKYYTWVYKEAYQVVRTTKIVLPDMIVNLTLPTKPVVQPFIMLNAYEPAVDYKITSIAGRVNSFMDFTCDGARCEVPILKDSTIEFWATSSMGDTSKTISATLRVLRTDGGYLVTAEAVSPFTVFNDYCASVFGINQNVISPWAEFPQTPAGLATAKTYHYLSGRLISAGVVNASSCPGGGFLDNGAPNACGVDAARSTVNNWQNQFDPIIWTSSRSGGIPPRLVKALIELESQFWPGNSQLYINEYGLAQLNYLGVDAALRWDMDLFKQVCNSELYDCSRGYNGMPGWLQAQAKGELLQMLNATCTSCQYGIDLANASQSIPILVSTLRANCNQSRYLMESVGVSPRSYDDMWRFTLVSYHSGFQCLLDGLQETRDRAQTIDWEHVSKNLNCLGSRSYVESLWSGLQEGLNPANRPVEPDQPTVLPTMTTPTPIPSPTPYLSNATLRVVVFEDANHDQLPQPDEMVDGVDVRAEFSDGTAVTQAVTGGQTVINLSRKVVGTKVSLSVAYLFRAYQLSIPAQGEMLVVIRLDQPAAPTALP